MLFVQLIAVHAPCLPCGLGLTILISASATYSQNMRYFAKFQN